jgi:hypothetical protein
MSPVSLSPTHITPSKPHTFTDSNGDMYRVLDSKHVMTQKSSYGHPSYVNIAVPTWSVPLDGVISVFSAVKLDDEKDRRIVSLTKQIAELEHELRSSRERIVTAVDILEGNDDE